MLKDLLLRVLNQTVGEYFENIDASQLKLSVFSGNIALSNLTLKKNVCDGLGLPFRILAGKCATLSLSIPWTAIWSSPVEVLLKDLYVLVVPSSSSLPYNHDTEENARLRFKLQLLDSIEIAQKELSLVKIQATEPGYIEKLAIQIAKNLQIRIEAIHIRYEDDETNEGKNFSIGCLLSNLSILTTDVKWEPRYVSDNAPTLHKLLKLEGFSIYCNSNSLMVSKLHGEVNALVEQLSNMRNNSKFDHMLGPISITTKLRLTPNPEKGPKPFTEPKIWVETVIGELAINLSNLQYQDILHLATSLDHMFRREHYRKFHPHTKKYKGNYRLWWLFAYNCVLEDVQRKRNNWRWSNMKRHRQKCNAYYQAYFKKKMQGSTRPELQAELEQLEKSLNIFNILLIRKQVDLIRQRHEVKLKSEQGWGTWMKSWVTPETISPVEHPPVEPITPEEMTPEEKQSILVAIGFSPIPGVVKSTSKFPQEYVLLQIDFRLGKLKLIITQDSRIWNARRSLAEGSTNVILHLAITKCALQVNSRPVKKGLKVAFKLERIDAYGGDAPLEEEDEDEERDVAPHIIAPRKTQGQGVTSLLEILFQMAPLEMEYDKSLRIHGRPLDITFDRNTMNKLIDCFSLPKKLNIQKLQSKALLTYNQLKSRSKTSMKSIMMQQEDLFEIDIRLEAPCIIVPQFSNVASSRINVLVVELGELIVSSQLIDDNSSFSTATPSLDVYNGHF